MTQGNGAVGPHSVWESIARHLNPLTTRERAQALRGRLFARHGVWVSLEELATGVRPGHFYPFRSIQVANPVQ
jgi:hypothetical protein